MFVCVILSACSDTGMALLRDSNILNHHYYFCSNCLIMALKQTFKKCFEKQNYIGWPVYIKTLPIYTKFTKLLLSVVSIMCLASLYITFTNFRSFLPNTLELCIIIHLSLGIGGFQRFQSSNFDQIKTWESESSLFLLFLFVCFWSKPAESVKLNLKTHEKLLFQVGF